MSTTGFWGRVDPPPVPVQTRDVYMLCYRPNPDFEPLYRTPLGSMHSDPRYAEKFTSPAEAFQAKQEKGLISLKVVVMAVPA